MRKSFLLFCSATVALGVMFAPEVSHAQSAWRCVDDPTKPDCEEALINDIEDITVRDWPNPLSIPLPPIPYSCAKRFDTGGNFIVANSVSPQSLLASQAQWYVTLWGSLRSFLIGRYTASADLYGGMQLTGTGLGGITWLDTGINYLFQEGTAEVMASGGSTGVLDLGPVAFSSPVGSFWGSTVPVEIQLLDGTYDCTFGYSGKTVKASGRGTVRFFYPIEWLPVKDVLAEAVREQFRRAVRIAVTGSP